MTSTQVEVDNISLVRKGYEAFSAGDMATLAELFQPNAVWHDDPMGVLPGNAEGRDAIFAIFARLAQETAGTFRATPTAMAATGDKVFVESTATGERQGRRLTTNEVLVFTLAEGRVSEVALYHRDHDESVAFWS
jgi:uncharacterized protein